MLFVSRYHSPVGNLLLASKNEKLVGLWIEQQKYYLSNFKEEYRENDNLPILLKTKSWLDRYFSGKRPEIDELEIEFIGSDFRKSVWAILCKIPYGEVITYQEVANMIARKMGIKTMSAQAIGGAVSHNPISIIIPCHRVVSTSGNLTGYAGGITKKIYLLEHEGVDMSHLFVPTLKKEIL